MDYSKIKLYFNTVRYLKFKQVYYRVFYLLRDKIARCNRPLLQPRYELHKLEVSNDVISPKSYRKKNTFTFLNQSQSFSNGIDWNFSEKGKLWTYNLNYFDFLNQNNLEVQEGITLIRDFIKKETLLKDGKEAYPISLRGINWIKFFCFHNIVDKEMNDVLYKHYQLLIRNLEYHLLGNHLLENGFSLLFAAYYFQSDKFYNIARKIIFKQLEEQTLDDGGHFELSPMYHKIILQRTLECLALVEENDYSRADKKMRMFLLEKSEKMLSFLKSITYENGEVPMVNDSAFGIAPSSEVLFKMAERLGVTYKTIELRESGYRKFDREDYELFVDVGEVGPMYQAGHAHADILNFELHIFKSPFIVDTGTSTYENNSLRTHERSTDSHNTVVVNSKNQSEVWGGFRVGKRARISNVFSSKDVVKGEHNGYKKLVGNHIRHFRCNAKSIEITDNFSKRTPLQLSANFHFHSSVKILSVDQNIVSFNNGVQIYFSTIGDDIKITRKKFLLATGFNQSVEADKLTVNFVNNLSTRIVL